MNKDLEKLLFNPIRLKIISFLISVDKSSFKSLSKISGATKGNLSIQIKKLNEAGYIKIKKSFNNNYPNTTCSITIKGKNSFKLFFKELQLYKNNQR
ncbi:MAG: transcriptional regulator [Flavobacteriaceae bacterium]|nr:transcriptional regulator [Flavobacteriaceae bacterium]